LLYVAVCGAAFLTPLKLRKGGDLWRWVTLPGGEGFPLRAGAERHLLRYDVTTLNGLIGQRVRKIFHFDGYNVLASLR